MVFLYQALSIILSPLIDAYLTFRKFKKKEDKYRFYERFGHSKVSRPEGTLIWIHCASVGESKSSIALAEAILAKHSLNNILITSGTITSAKQIIDNLPKRTIHQYVPVDKLIAVKRFLHHWQPNLAIFIESELWPNLITQTKKFCKLVLVNGRVSEKSFKNWQKLHKIGFNLLKNFSICFAQSQSDRKKFINLGLKNTYFVGNLKSYSPLLRVNQLELTNLRQQTSNRVIWLAASTHKGEEEIIIKTHQQLKKYFPNLLTIIIPRHPNRLEEIVKLIPKNLDIAIRSKKQPIDNCEIYLADTMGELGIFYSLSKISLICGSLIDNIGGHNPFEPIWLKSVILSGCYVKNNEEVYYDLARNGSCLMIKNEKELLFYLLKIMKDKNYYLLLLKNTTKLQTNKKAIVNDILDKLYPL
jgi:3-deoxy-D-manno-octulosonic-acid transferase